ncbi:MAG: VWA domain-containing protein [Chloroflexi bacterium]|nr:VWA domain-containing protein [Chloroflexota bacterium]
MDQRMVEFIRALRGAGVRISLAESQDALRAVELIGVGDRAEVVSTLRATLVKEHKDSKVFDFFFPLFFDTNAPPMWDVSQELDPDQQEMLQQALQSLMGDQQALEQLMQQLMQGQQFTREQLDQMAQQLGMQNAQHMYQQNYFGRQMERMMGMQAARDTLEQLMEELRAMGMSEEALQELREMLEENMGALSEQISKYVGSNIAQNLAEQELAEPRRDVEDLNFQHLSPDEAEQVRDEMRRLAARLRSRASLRQKRARVGELDPKGTIRANLKYGGVPLELRHRTRHVKPKLVVICDLSGSMRYMSEFMLTLTYMLQDLVAKARSFIFIDDMVEVTDHFKAERPEAAVERVLRENPRGYYTTDLGNSLATFFERHIDSVDSKTSVILVGDGRNNFNNPRLDLAQQLTRRGRRCIWFCPEPEHMWGTGDSDLNRYAPLSDAVYLVRNLRELSAAVDDILADR